MPGFCPIEDELKYLSQARAEERGAIFTRREVVDFILDLVGYIPKQKLHNLTLVEPSFGNGDFLLVAVERLLQAWQNLKKDTPVNALENCIRAVELHQKSFESTRAKLVEQLQNAGIDQPAATKLIGTWLIHDDYLLADLPRSVHFVVGNPPYMRQELIPDALSREYRNRYATFFDRADIYVPFIERSLKLLSDGGKLGFICADRWMKNRYGGPLRQLVSNQFHLHVYVDMIDTHAFHSDVIAYPGIFIIGRDNPGPTRVTRRPEINRTSMRKLASELTGTAPPDPDGTVKELTNVIIKAQPWILESSKQLELVRRLERDFPTIEEAGCKIGIGVATGADKAFIANFDDLDVEDDRKLPIAKTSDIVSGKLEWQGLGIVNPFADEGGLVILENYPRLKHYLEERKIQIVDRYIAQKVPANWYRTIDRIYPALARTPKLLIPDIKGEANIVYEDGKVYPHHNLYYITSDHWDLRALQAVLLSGIARLFVAAYSTRMRGGYLRYQAQYLRRIRLPHWSNVCRDTINDLSVAAKTGNAEACNRAVYRLYQLNADERIALSDSTDR